MPSHGCKKIPGKQFQNAIALVNFISLEEEPAFFVTVVQMKIKYLLRLN